MFQKVHFRLTILCTSITTFILLILSFGCLFISESSLKESSFVSFQNDMNSILGTIEQQTTLTHEWLKRMEDNGKYQIFLLDNDTPLIFGEQHSPTESQIADKAFALYEDHLHLNSESPISHQEFSFSSMEKGTDNFYACVAVFQRKGGTLKTLILMPTYSLSKRIQSQRLLFFSLDLLAIIALSLFSWHFTKRLLLPLKENQQKQIQFVAAASHELRTPLSVILACASAAQQADPEKKTHFLTSIQTEGQRMSHLIHDMLLLTNADNQNWTIKKAPTELDTLLLSTYEIFEPIAVEKSIHFQIQLPTQALPDCLCDEERIRQVLLILLQNAVSYTSEHGKIQLSLDYDKRHFILQVCDNGKGISNEQKKHIFDRFYRADPSHSQKEHFGLGLSIAMEIIKAHKGQISVKDTPGGGSTFTVIL